MVILLLFTGVLSFMVSVLRKSLFFPVSSVVEPDV
ncbi:Uncharacterised protein [Salmonella enterica]|nr:Uncharacterised protein [Salmonella enterica]